MTREPLPQISVVIPTYNRAAYLGAAIESAIRQEGVDKEILVVDDGSLDGTRDVIAHYVDAEQVRYLYQDNAGVSAARNRGITEARGEFVAFLDSDDTWVVGHLERLYRTLARYPHTKMAFSNFVFTGTRDADECNVSFRKSVGQLLSLSFARASEGAWTSTDRLLEGLFEIGFPFRIQGSMFSRPFLLAHGIRFDEEVSFTEEAQFVIEASRHAAAVFLDEPGVVISRSDGNSDDAYGPKITRSYERRIRRLKELFSGSGRLNRDQRRALRHHVLRMQTHIMNDRARDRHLPTMIREAARLLIEVPSQTSLKPVARLLMGRHARRAAAKQLER